MRPPTGEISLRIEGALSPAFVTKQQPTLVPLTISRLFKSDSINRVRYSVLLKVPTKFFDNALFLSDPEFLLCRTEKANF